MGEIYINCTIKYSNLEMFKVAALYKFVHIDDCPSMKGLLSTWCEEMQIEGGLIVAPEGINGTVAGLTSKIDLFITALSTLPNFDGLSVKFSEADKRPFYRMRIRISPEIITMGASMESLCQETGHYVDPVDWNDLISSPDITLIDTRNDYEVDIGTFEGAINPKTTSFGEFPDYVDKSLPEDKSVKIAMFCTGGIRCEKASSYLMKKGYENVYQLKGGILKYLEEIPAEQSLWNGQCYVFDQRVSVGHNLVAGNLSQCRACRHVLHPDDMLHTKFKDGVHCGYCFDSLSPETIQANEERHKQIVLAERQEKQHLGMKKRKCKMNVKKS